MKTKYTGTKVLLIDIETSPLVVYTWGLVDVNISLNQIVETGSILSWSAKWYTDPNGKTYGPHDKMMYKDTSRQKNRKDDSKILPEMWDLLTEADYVISQNGISFDSKVLNAGFILNETRGGGPPAKYEHIDTLREARKNFKFPSNKLEHLAKELCEVSKMTERKFNGQSLWTECLNGNQKAWKEMKAYNNQDVIVLEQLFERFKPWIKKANFAGSSKTDCKTCGSKNVWKKGIQKLASGAIFQKYHCNDCGSWFQGTENLVPKEQRKPLFKKM